MVQFSIQKNLKLKMYRNLSWILCRPQFWVHEREKPSLTCVDTSNSFVSKKWFQKTFQQHCNMCGKEIWIKTQFERSYWKDSWINLAFRRIWSWKCTAGIYLGFFADLIFGFMKGEKSSLMCVDTSNSFITKECFQKTLNQHCNICDQEICMKNQFVQSYWRDSWFNLASRRI